MLMPSPSRLTAETLASELVKLPLLSAATGPQAVPAQIAIARAIASGQSTDEIATVLSTPSGWEEELRRRMHDPIPSQGQWLRQVVTGCFAYHAVPSNLDALAAFRYHIMVLWMRMLTRRSQKDRTGWDRINRLADQWLPKPRILHPWPNQRFAVKHPRWEPDAGIPHVRFWCSEASCHSSG